MNPISNLISTHHGYLHERAGLIISFFDDPDDAIRCADSMRQSFGIDVDVVGSQLTFVDRRRNSEDYPSDKNRRKTSARIQ